MVRYLKFALYWLSWIFVFLLFLCSLGRIGRLARKYRKNKLKKSPYERRNYLYKAIKKYFYLRRIKVTDINIEKIHQRQVFIVANHKNNLDPIVLLYLSCKYNFNALTFLAKQELKESRIAYAALTLIDCILIDRNNIRSVYKGYEKENELLQKGISLVVFPEGTRVIGEHLGEFNEVSFKVAYTTCTPIFPICIYGSNNRKLFKNKIFHYIYVEGLPVLKPSDFINVQMRGLCREIRGDLQKKYDELDALYQRELVSLDKQNN